MAGEVQATFFGFDIGKLFTFEPLSVLAIVSIGWLAFGPVLAVLLSSYSVTLSPPGSRLRAGGAENGEPASAPFLRYSRSVFGLYAVIGMIVVPTFVYVFLPTVRDQFAEPPSKCGDPYPAVLLINSLNLAVVFGYGLLCHFLAARLYMLFSRGR